MNTDNRKTQVFTKSTRTYSTPKVVTQDNWDGWSECDNCGRKMVETDNVFTHWKTVRKVYVAFEKVTDWTLSAISEFNNDFDDFVFVTCSKKCSHQKLVKWTNRNGDN